MFKIVKYKEGFNTTEYQNDDFSKVLSMLYDLEENAEDDETYWIETEKNNDNK